MLSYEISDVSDPLSVNIVRLHVFYYILVFSFFFSVDIVNIINKSTFEHNPAYNLLWEKELCL